VNINLKQSTVQTSFFQSATDYLIYIGAPAVVVILVLTSICIYLKVRANENKVSELERIEDMHFNSGRYMINGRHQGGYDMNEMKSAEQKVIRDKFPLPEEEVEITSFREAMYH
jgi:hypothetical protein